MTFDLTLAVIAGALVGLAVSLPMGPVAIIVIQRTLARGKLAGFVTGLGSAIADVLTASIAAFGIQVLLDFLVRESSIIRLIGGVILLVFGIISMYTKPREREKRVDTFVNKIQYFFSGFILTITNPFTIFAFFIAFANILPILGVKAAIHAGPTGEIVGIGTGLAVPISLVLGILIGTGLWWILVTNLAELYEHKITPQKLVTINKWLGGLVVVVAIIILISAILVHF